ncbi:MAG: hypothetical protein ACO3JL_02860 [Myxococcota bacterium]
MPRAAARRTVTRCIVSGLILSAVGCQIPLPEDEASLAGGDLAQGVYGGMEFLSITEGGSYPENPLLQVSVPAGTRYVVYSANGYVLGVSSDKATDYAVTPQFSVLGPRTIIARAFDGNDRQVGEVSVRIVLYSDENPATINLGFVSPSNDGGTYLNGIWFKVRTQGVVDKVRYSADGFVLGESGDAASEYAVRYTFTQLGYRTVVAQGLNSSGAVIAEARRSFYVVDEAGNGGPTSSASSGGGSTSTSTTRAGIAGDLLTHHNAYRLTLWNQTFGRNDGADPLSNISDTAAGRAAYTSCYGSAPCNQVNLSTTMLKAMRTLREQYSYNYFVTSIAGASHSYGSLHYTGRAFDIDEINGVRINGTSSQTNAFMSACWALGAVEVFGPSNDPYGHYDHIHCAF